MNSFKLSVILGFTIVFVACLSHKNIKQINNEKAERPVLNNKMDSSEYLRRNAVKYSIEEKLSGDYKHIIDSIQKQRSPR